MKIQDEIKTALETFQNMKKYCCEKNKGPTDLAPMLHFKYKHLNAYCGVLLGEGHPLETIPHAWGQIVQDGVPEFVVVMTEGYAKVGGDPSDYRKGDMEKDFKNNPDSEVLEVLNIHGIDLGTGKQADGFVSFKYGDDGLPVFDEPSYGDCEGAALGANIPILFEACRQATFATLNKAV